MRKLAVFAVIITFVFSVSAARAAFSKDKIIGKAAQAAGSMGHPSEKSDIFYDEENTEWKKVENSITSLYNRNSIPLPETFEQISGRDYQAVRFAPRSPGATDGTIWIFVDRETGEVISNFFISQ
jgi:hypothetical protein